MMSKLNWLGRALGVVCGVAVAGAWTFALWVPAQGGLTLTGVSVVTALALIAFGLFAAVAALHGHAIVVALFFLASFFPVGAFVMPTDHWLKWVGWIDLGLAVAAILLWLTRPRAPAPA